MPANDIVADTLTRFHQDWHESWHYSRYICLQSTTRWSVSTGFLWNAAVKTLVNKYKIQYKKLWLFLLGTHPLKQASNVQYKPILLLSKYDNYVFIGVWQQDFLETLSCWSILYRRSMGWSFLLSRNHISIIIK